MTPADTPGSETSDLGDSAPFAQAGASPANEQIEAAPTNQQSDRFAGLREQAFGLRDQAFGHARDYVTSGKDTLSQTLGGYAETVREAANEIEERAGPEIARYAHQAADFLDEAVSTLRDKDVDELLDEARDLVRRSPALAIGAAAAMGFALSRFLKATSDSLDRDFVPSSARTRGESRPSYDA